MHTVYIVYYTEYYTVRRTEKRFTISDLNRERLKASVARKDGSKARLKCIYLERKSAATSYRSFPSVLETRLEMQNISDSLRAAAKEQEIGF